MTASNSENKCKYTLFVIGSNLSSLLSLCFWRLLFKSLVLQLWLTLTLTVLLMWHLKNAFNIWDTVRDLLSKLMENRQYYWPSEFQNISSVNLFSWSFFILDFLHLCFRKTRKQNTLLMKQAAWERDHTHHITSVCFNISLFCHFFDTSSWFSKELVVYLDSNLWHVGVRLHIRTQHKWIKFSLRAADSFSLPQWKLPSLMLEIHKQQLSK